MSGWTTHTGTAIAFDRESVDTDQIIPARFMSTPRSDGYGGFLFADLRDGDATFPLNRAPDASILIARRNFGSGSSREAAVYALVDFGIRVVVAPSFGDIFASNAVNNGLLPARIDATASDALFDRLGTKPTTMTADLVSLTLTAGDTTIPFEIDPIWREKLTRGWDDIDLTCAHHDTITAYCTQLADNAPWRFPAPAG